MGPYYLYKEWISLSPCSFNPSLHTLPVHRKLELEPPSAGPSCRVGPRPVWLPLIGPRHTQMSLGAQSSRMLSKHEPSEAHWGHGTVGAGGPLSEQVIERNNAHHFGRRDERQRCRPRASLPLSSALSRVPSPYCYCLGIRSAWATGAHQTPGRGEPPSHRAFSLEGPNPSQSVGGWATT